MKTVIMKDKESKETILTIYNDNTVIPKAGDKVKLEGVNFLYTVEEVLYHYTKTGTYTADLLVTILLSK